SASLIADNVAVAGGGIAVFRQGDVMPMLFVGDDVRIENNSATNGGGIYVWSAYLRIGGSGTIVRANHVSGDDAGGGGIAVLGSDPPRQALVEIVSGGADGAGIISANHAELGGGLYLGNGSTVQLYTTDPTQPVRLDHNDALLGGAVFVSGTTGDASIVEGVIDSNTSSLGGAAVVAWDGGRFTMRSLTATGVPADAVTCETPGACNRVSGNVAASVAAPMPGAIALLDNGIGASRSEVHFQSTHLLGNSGSSLFADRCRSANCAPLLVEIGNSRIVANPGAARLLEMGSGSGSHFGCDLCTIAGFAASSEPLFDTNGELILSRSILWQPGRDIIGGRTPSYVGADSLQLHDRADFPSPAFQNIEVGDPRFVAPETGDFRLGVNSPALDRADVSALPPFDLDGHARAVDQPAVPDRPGVADLGAYERADDGASSDTVFANGFD
ncbi:MAG: hypothetical protein ABIS07_15580, partial [Dokdonella sp.]